MARQSRKVKLFGQPTFGVIDTGIIGHSWVESPCGEIWLSYTNIRFNVGPRLMFDDIGIQPDIVIDNTIPDYRWVEHVTEIMSGWVAEPEPEPRRRRGRR